MAADLGAWAATALAGSDHVDVDAGCRALVRALGDAGWLRYCVPAAHGEALAAVDSRALCLARETLAYHDGLADFAFVMQGLGTGAISLFGSARCRRRTIRPRSRPGKRYRGVRPFRTRQRLRRRRHENQARAATAPITYSTARKR